MRPAAPSTAIGSGDVAVLAVAKHYLDAGEDSSVREQLAPVVLGLFKAPDAAPGFVATLNAVSAMPTLADDIVAKNELCYARWDRFPASKGHLLLIPYRHTPDLFSMTAEERLSMFALIDDCRIVIEENFRPAGYNIGFNTGAAAGQTVMHCHCHMIPRYVGDVREPRGGIRGVVMGKQMY